MTFYIGCGIVLQQGEKYILVQETRHEKAGLYNMPAGTLEIDEDLLQCITRETKEETGADITVEHFVGIYQTVIANGHNVVFAVFAGRAAEGTAFFSEEHDIIQAFTYEEIEEFNQRGQLRSPIVLQAITDFRGGQKLPLTAVKAWHVESLSSITVAKDH